MKHEEAFEKTNNALNPVVNRANPDAYKIMCLFTDASSKNLAGTLTKIPKTDAV